jgi:sigma-B regulation protein RsbU (phosphoserine phosphatase)
MTLKPRSSIAFKMMLLVLGGTSIVFGIILLYSYYSSRNFLLEESESNARHLTQYVARRIEQEFRSVAKATESLAGFLETAKCDEETLLALLRRTVLRNKEIYGSCVAFQPYAFDKNTRAFAPYYFRGKEGLKFEQLGSDAYDYFTKDWYHIPVVLKEPMWIEPYFDEGGGDIMMTTFSFPFYERDASGKKGELRGLVCADVSLEWLTRLVSSIRIETSGFCFIISETGTFVTHPQPKMIMRESIFSLAEELKDPRVRQLGRAMIRQNSGFVDIGSLPPVGEAFLAYAPISAVHWSVGAIFPKAELLADVTALHQQTVLMALTGMGLLFLVSLLVAKSFSRPLRRIAQATVQVAGGNLDINLSDIRSRDEVGQLAQAFTRMTEGLKERDFIRDTFGRYLTKEVVNRLLESSDGLRLGGEKREISMIMSDLRGFTALTATMHPEQVIAFLNRYLGRMVDVLVDYRGIIDEIIGDGILAFFGAPETLEDHPARAVACALKMQIEMDEINALNEQDGLPRLEMGVAVNTGAVVVGNIGSEKRTKYGAVGSEVNMTGRIQSFTVGGQVLISESTYNKLADILDIGDVLQVQMKGVPGAVKLYDVAGIRGQYDVHLKRQEEKRILLSQKINVAVQRVDEKTVALTEASAWIEEISASSAQVVLAYEINQWQDVKLLLLDDESRPSAGEIYGKVVSVTQVGSHYVANVRFTSVSPEAYQMIHRLEQAT